MDGGRKLTRTEFDQVIRRASEMAAHESEAGELNEAELLRIASEVGLPEHHVRRALAEVRSGSVGPAPSGVVDRLFGPETVRAARVVPGTARELAATLDEFLAAGQLLQPVRRNERMLQYRPAVDWASQVARAASSSARSHFVASANFVDVRLDDAGEEGRTLVEIEVDPGTRGDSVAGAVMGVIFGGGGAAFGVSLAMMSVAPAAVGVAIGLAAGGLTAAAVGSWARNVQSKKNRDVVAEIEGILDRLELGESLEPPPPSWRRWVKRQFHGARTFLEDNLEGL